jgi:transcription elongation factor Elf1
MRRFEYKGEMLTLKELLPYSVVPEKTLRSRLFTGTSLWTVESALTTPFGKTGKTPEVSKAIIDIHTNKLNKKATKQLKESGSVQSSERGSNRDVFTCLNCGFEKSKALIGMEARRTGFYCTSCVAKAERNSNLTEAEVKQKASINKIVSKRYKDGTVALYFVTGEEEYKKS